MSTENKSPEATGGDRALASRIGHQYPHDVWEAGRWIAAHRESAVAQAVAGAHQQGYNKAVSDESAKREVLEQAVEQLQKELTALRSQGDKL